MNKKAVFITQDGKLVDVLDVKTITEVDDFNKLVRDAETNRQSILERKNKEEQVKQNLLNKRLEKLELGLNLASLEIELLRGQITEEEYEERKNKLCGTK